MPLSKLLEHLQSKPCCTNIVPIVVGKSKDTSGIETYQVPITQLSRNPNMLYWTVATFLYMGVNLALYVKKSGDYWQFTVVMFECPAVCSDFNIKMEVYATDSRPDTRLSAKVRCHPCSIDDPLAEMKGLGLVVHHRLMKRMILKEDSFRFTVSLSFF